MSKGTQGKLAVIGVIVLVIVVALVALTPVSEARTLCTVFSQVRENSFPECFVQVWWGLMFGIE